VDGGWPLGFGDDPRLRARRKMRVNEAVNLNDKLAAFTDHFAPRTVATFNGHDITDDFFLVLKGRLEIRLRDRTIALGPGELFVVPRGIEHQPFATEETHILLIEQTGTPNTGDPATAQPRRVV